MHILFIVENYHPHIGGVETVFKNLAEGLVKHGHAVTVLTHQLKNTKIEEIVRGVRILRIPCFQSRYWFSLLAIPKAIALAKAANIIHTTTYNGALPAKISSIITRKPLVITIHELLGKKWREFGGGFLFSQAHRILEWIIIHSGYERIAAVSESTFDQLKRRNLANITVVYNGIDYKHFDPKKYRKYAYRKKLGLSDQFAVLFFGRPGISKGLEFLIQAIPIAAKEIPNLIVLLMVSKDPAYTSRYKAMMHKIQRMKIENKVRVLDPVPLSTLPAYIASSDCVVVPSLSEGFGFSVAESCAMGVPVVASKTTSIPEVISGKYVLVEPGNPLSIAQGIVKVYKGRVEKKPLKKFFWEETVKKYESIYQELRQ